MFLERGQTCTFYMSLPLRTGTEDVDAEGKPRGKDLAERARSLSIGTGEKDWIGWCRSRSAPGSNKPVIKYGRIIGTSARKLSLLPLAREGLPLPEQRNVCTRVRRYVAAPGSGDCLFQSVKWDMRVNIHLVKGAVCQPPGSGCWTSRSADPMSYS